MSEIQLHSVVMCQHYFITFALKLTCLLVNVTQQREQFLFQIAPLRKSNNMQVEPVELKWNFRDVKQNLSLHIWGKASALATYF